MRSLVKSVLARGVAEIRVWEAVSPAEANDATTHGEVY